MTDANDLPTAKSDGSLPGGAQNVSEPAAESDDERGLPDEEWKVGDEVETTYESTELGHRITRRVVKRKSSSIEEDVTETITEPVYVTLPEVAYQAPRTDAHPTPVG